MNLFISDIGISEINPNGFRYFIIPKFYSEPGYVHSSIGEGISYTTLGKETYTKMSIQGPKMFICSANRM